MKLTTKIFAFFLILVALVSMTVTICAEEANGATVTAKVIANNSPLYSVAIPTGISVEDLKRTAESSYSETEFSIQVMDTIGLNGQKIYVRISGEDGAFVLKNEAGTSTLPYAVSTKENKENPVGNGKVFATFVGQGKQYGYILIDQKNIKQADTYTGNLRFTFSVGD